MVVEIKSEQRQHISIAETTFEVSSIVGASLTSTSHGMVSPGNDDRSKPGTWYRCQAFGFSCNH